MQPLKINLVGYLFGKYPELTCGSSRLKFQWNWDTPGRVETPWAFQLEKLH